MKIRPIVRKIHADNQPIYADLQSRIGALFLPVCTSKKWHFESRVKAEDSFALKVESGRGWDASPAEMEDFFACTIVVRNSTEIADAVATVLVECDEKTRRPPSTTHAGRASSFEFDDLRLFVKLRSSPGLRPNEAYNRVFEVQIRTFLFHAWQIATHDLTYKTDQISWSRARVAYQVRAMLEQAEVAIRSAEDPAFVNFLAREDRDTSDLKKIIEILRKAWAPSLLPKNLKQLAENIQSAIKALQIDVETLEKVVDAAIARNGISLDQGPYQSILLWLIKEEEPKFKHFIRRDKAWTRLVLYDDLDFPKWILPPAAKNVIVVKGK